MTYLWLSADGDLCVLSRGVTNAYRRGDGVYERVMPVFKMMGGTTLHTVKLTVDEVDVLIYGRTLGDASS